MRDHKHSILKTVSAPSLDLIESKIFNVRGKRVMLDKDLAVLYKVETRRLNEQVSRNKERFPADFMFQLTLQEIKNLKSHFAISSWGGRRSLPYAFTEQGVAMLSSVLKSHQAVIVNIYIMRAFVNLRRASLTYVSLKNKINALEKRCDKQFSTVFEVIRQLLTPPEEARKGPIGFH